MDIQQIHKDEFFKSELYQNSTRELQETFITLFNKLEENKIQFTIKIRKGNSLALSPVTNINKNIITIWVYNDHLRITLYNKNNINIYSKKDINELLLDEISNKYYEINKDKKQISIYLTEDLISRAQKKATKMNKKFNEFITESIESNLNTLFINSKHKMEFYSLLKDSGIHVKDNDKCNKLIPEKLRKIITFFYIVSAYQDDYLLLYKSKFKYDKKSNSIIGPSELVCNWNTDMHNCCAAAYGISEILGGNITLQKFMELLDDDDGGNVFKLFTHALELMYGSKYTIKDTEIVAIKPLEITTINNFNDFLNKKEED